MHRWKRGERLDPLQEVDMILNARTRPTQTPPPSAESRARRETHPHHLHTTPTQHEQITRRQHTLHYSMDIAWT